MNDQEILDHDPARRSRMVGYLIAILSGPFALILTDLLGILKDFPLGVRLVGAAAISMYLTFEKLDEIQSSVERMPALRSDMAYYWRDIGRTLRLIPRQKIGKSASVLVNYWKWLLFQPVQLSWNMFEMPRGDTGSTRRYGPYLLSTASLFALNFLVSRLAIGILLPGRSIWLTPMIWLLLVPLGLMTYSVLKGASDRQLEDVRLTVFAWFALIAAWASVLSASLKSEEYFGVALLLNSFAAGLICGCGGGATIETLVKTNSPPRVSWVGIWSSVVFAVIFTYLFTIDIQSVASMQIPNADPVISIIYSSQGDSSSAEQLDDVSRSEIGEADTTPGSTLISQPELVNTESLAGIPIISFLAAIAGFAMGINGDLLWLLEAPVFWAGCLMIRIGLVSPGRSLTKRIVTLDDWRRDDWPGEPWYYSTLCQKYPQELTETLISQAFNTARYSAALNYLSRCLRTKHPQEVLQIVLPLLPYVSSAETTPWLIPRTQEFADAPKSGELHTLFLRRMSFFGDLASYLTKADSRTDVSVLQALNKMVASDRPNVLATREDAAFIEAQLKLYETASPKAVVMRLLYRTIADALDVETLSDLASTTQEWLELGSHVSGDLDLLYAIDLIDGFAVMSSIADESSNNETVFGNIALRLLCIQRVLQDSRGNEVPTLGYRDFAKVAEHWGEILTLQICPSGTQDLGVNQ